MEDLALGGVGLIITGHANVVVQGQAGPWQLGIYSDDHISGLKTMTHAVHSAEGRIVAQLAHAGNFAAEQFTRMVPCVPSVYEGLAKTPRHELTKDEIRDLVQAFADAALRARQAGFDGVQIHSAHGYLLSQFLSPEFNRRTDAYGGSIENRSRIHMEILKAMRKSVGNDFPILIKINCQDFQDNGLALGDTVWVCRQLADNGMDAIELSGGTLTGGKLSPSRVGISSPEKEAYFQQEAAAVKAAINIPLILVGGIRSLEVAERLVAERRADYLSMCRPLIREPGLVNRWKSGDTRPATCLSDNLCFRPAMAGRGIHCVVDERERKKG
jgi:2,4-dienoyl-CoA reductase-like NADH-dependent reductase (Old Yellow Enzyme family)